MQYENLRLEIKDNAIYMTFQGQAPLFWKHACQFLLQTLVHNASAFGVNSEKLEKLSHKVGMTSAKFHVFRIELGRPHSIEMDHILGAFCEVLPVIRKIAHIKGGIYNPTEKQL